MDFPQSVNLGFLHQNVLRSRMKGPKLSDGWEADSSLCAHIIGTKSHMSKDYTCMHNNIFTQWLLWRKHCPSRSVTATMHAQKAFMLCLIDEQEWSNLFVLKKKIYSLKRTKKAYAKIWLTAAIMDCHVKRAALLILLHNELDARLSSQVWLCTLPSILPTSWHLKYSKTT